MMVVSQEIQERMGVPYALSKQEARFGIPSRWMAIVEQKNVEGILATIQPALQKETTAPRY
jgi:hypothetical protein